MKILLGLLELLEQKFGSLQEVKMKILQDDSEILEFLLTHKEAKERYFLDCKGHLVFKKDSFLTFLKTRILDSSYTKFSNKIGLGVNDSFLKTSEKVVLNFPFKDCVLKGGQSKDEQKINEIFFNEILGRDEIDVLFSKKALCNFEFITPQTLQNLRDSSRADSAKSKDSMKSPPQLTY